MTDIKKTVLSVTHFNDLQRLQKSIMASASSGIIQYGDDCQIIAPDYSVREVPPGLDFYREDLNAYDIGGAGDCFFMALNFAVFAENVKGMKIGLYHPKDWYSFLSLQDRTHVEDVHIIAVSNRLQCSIVMYAKRSNKLSVQKFGDYPKVITMVELDGEHYVSCIAQTRSSLYQMLRLIMPSIEFDYHEKFELVFEDGSNRSWEANPGIDFKPEVVLPSQLSSEVLDLDRLFDEEKEGLVSDFIEENDPRYREDVSLNYFISFCHSIADAAKNSKKLENVDSKLYYKLRHNLFKTYCLNALGIMSRKEVPFSSIPSLRLDSVRTPDYLAVYSDSCILIEFTVSNRKDAVLKSKDYFAKYDPEIRLSAVPIKDFYVFATLDSDSDDIVVMLEKISHETGLPLSPNFKQEIDDVLKTIKTITSYFNDFCPEILSMNIDEFYITGLPDAFDSAPLFNEISLKRGKKSVKRVRVNNLVMRWQRRLVAQLRRKPGFGRYKIAVNFVTSSCYIEETAEGFEKDHLLNALDQLLFDDSMVHVVGDYYTEAGIFQGLTVPEEMEIDRVQKVAQDYDTEQYEERLYGSLFKYEMVTLQDKSIESSHYQAQKLYLDTIHKLHSANNVEHYKSSPFIFYPCSALVKGPFSIAIETCSPIFNTMLKVAYGKDTTSAKQIDREIDYEKLESLNRSVSKMGYDLKRKHLSDFKKYTVMNHKKFEAELERNPELSVFKEYRELKSRYSEVIIENTRIFYTNRIRMNLNTDDRWANETDHFRKPNNKLRIVTDLEHSTVLENYRSFMSELMQTGQNKASDKVFSDTEPLGATLAENCTQMREEIDRVEEDFLSTLLAHTCLLTSQVCYSLMYYSNIKLNKDDFVYDNLGYENVLLVVKGGKKIRTTRNSRMFRLLLPITHAQMRLVDSHTNSIIYLKDSIYLLTPWRMLRMGYLKKGFEMFHSVGTYYTSAHLEYNLQREQACNFMSIKVLLMLSQKRSLEVWSSILRYIYLNSLGTHTDLMALIPDMVMPDIDSLVFMLQRQFCKLLPAIHSSAQKGKLMDIFWEEEVENFDLAAERFEESLFMAKAPYNPVTEHLKNLKSVIDTHDYFMEHVGSEDPEEILRKTNITVGDGYFEKLEECDFNFDAKASFCVGKFCGKYFSATYTKSDLLEEFNSIVQSTYTSIATGKGMRDTRGEFEGSKGHDVVYKEFESYKIPEILKEFPKTPSSFSKLLAANETSFLKKISELKEFELVFDMKDKEQYKGSREIYVMSHDTKLMQNPLEKFFAKLCKAFPNELIHKPSSTRPKFIHSKIFEHTYEDKEVMYCTMDCRKWAPRSNLWKYYFFVKGMANYLPENFTSYFLKFWCLMFKKTIRVKNTYLELLKTNEGFRDKIIKYFRRRDDEYSELVMPYSFMMGIFNYLSSLMHAASQLYFSEKVSDRLGAVCNFLAHSDDSGGIIVAKDYKTCLKIYGYYEKFQRTLNHLMSRKKCCLSKRSFEMISIMYNDRRFIPMVHKFLTNVSFDPTGSGWYSDITAVVGKIVDLYNNGGSYLQCYAMMLSLSELYRKAYHLPRSKGLSKIPLAFGGVFNMHPVHLILIGSKSQECLLDLMESEEVRSRRIAFYIAFCGDYSLGMGGRLKYRIPYYKRHPDTLDLMETDRYKLDAVSTLPISSTLLDYMKHLNRLYDPKYVYSLTGVDSNQILLSTLYFPTSILNSTDTAFKLKDLSSLYQQVYLSGKIEYARHTYPKSGYSGYFRQVEAMKYDFRKVSVVSNKACKPVRYSTIENFGLRLTQENLMTLSAIEKWPELKSVFTHSQKFDSMKDFCMRVLPGTTDEKLSYLKNFDPAEKEDRTRSGYLFIPSQVKIDNVSRFFAYSMLYTSRRYYISKQKPQMFTPSDLNNFEDNIADMKHFCICLKVIARSKDLITNIERLSKSLSECPECKNKDESVVDLKIYRDMLGRNEFEDFTTNLPFSVYVTSQVRGSNIWFSSCDFDICTPFGTVESRSVNGEINTVWRVADNNNLPRLWQLYTQFCKSRGIGYNSMAYQDTGFKYPKLAFNDFNTPHCPPLFSKCMVLPNSMVMQGSVPTRKVYRKGNSFYSGDKLVDFCIYAIYDVNQLFYETHRLAGVKDLLYDTELEVPRDVLLEKFYGSKIYKLLLNDERHSSTQSNKYVRNGFLGQPGSFTRALTVSDEKGATRYRSSYNPQYIAKGTMEFDTIEGVPVVDMFPKLSMSRLTTRERAAFGKALENRPLSYTDQQNLVRVKRKMGLESLGTAVTLYKHVMRGMMAGSMSGLPINMALDMLRLMLTVIHDCMNEYPREEVVGQYFGRPKTFWSVLKSIVLNDLDYGIMPNLIAQGLLRSKNDNQDRFWQSIRDDPLLSCMIINSHYYANLIAMVRGMVVRKDVAALFKTLLYDGETPKFRHLALSRNIYIEIEGDTDLIVNAILGQGQPVICTEDMLDAITGGDDMGEVLEEMEEEGEEVEERLYEGDDYKALIICDKDLKKVMQETAINDYETITLVSPVSYLCFPWLGKGKFIKRSYMGLDMYVSSFPEHDDFPRRIENDYRKVEEKRLNELIKTKEEVEEKISKEKIYVPNSIRSREEAEKIFREMGIYIPNVTNALFPGASHTGDWVAEMFNEYMKVGGIFGQEEIKIHRAQNRYHLPGFQGVVDDKILKAEIESIFGSNGHYLFTGSVRLNESLYKQFMRNIKRLFNQTDATGRAKLIFIASTLIDTVPHSNSDGWYVDRVSEMIEDIESKLDDGQDVMMLPVSARQVDELSYTEKDIFE